MKKQLESLKDAKFQTHKLSPEMLRHIKGGSEHASTVRETGDKDSSNFSCSGADGKIYDRTTTWKSADGVTHIQADQSATIFPGSKASWYD